MRIAESASHQIFERSRRYESNTLSKFASVLLIIPNQNVVEPSGSSIEFEYYIFQPTEAVTVSDSDFDGSWAMSGIEAFGLSQ